MSNLNLFDETYDLNPKTQGVKYAGSKLKLIPNILLMTQGLEIHTVFDGFSGTTRVSQAFAKSGFQVISNDISSWSYAFAQCYLQNKKPPTYYQELIDYLNSLKGVSGWFTRNYGGFDYAGSSVQSDGLKRVWQIHNTQKLDAIRNEIDNLKLDDLDKAVALTSLMLAMDEVDNTLGHFTSYLKNWSKRSYKHMLMKVPLLFMNTHNNVVTQGDIFDTLPKNKVDLAYLDPPYGSNNEKMPPSRVRYASYYHIWETICKNDKPELFGVAKRRTDSSDTVRCSLFEEFRKDDDGQFIAVKAIDRLIKSVNAKYIMLSYSSGGKATAFELNEILNKYGNIVKTLKIDYKKNVMAGMKWTNEWLRENEKANQEFLFLIEKN